MIGVRVSRCIKDCWHEVNENYRREEELRQSNLVVQETIRTYLESYDTRKLQIGTGTNLLASWLNTDLEPTSKQIIFLDATKPFPFPDMAFDFVFSEHMIEHITYKDGLVMLQEIFRVLRSGGKVRIATPDIVQIIGLYAPQKTALQERYLKWSATDILGLYKLEKDKTRGMRKILDIPNKHVTTLFPDAAHDSVCFVVNNFFRGFGHQFIYDESTLKAAMEWVGFTAVTRCQPGQSQHEALCGLESHGRLIGDDMNRLETMVLEAEKP